MVQSLSGREFARLVGVTENAVRAAIKNGRISRDADGRINPETQLPRWNANRDPAKVRGHNAHAIEAGRIAEERFPMRRGKIRGRKPVIDDDDEGLPAFEEVKTRKLLVDLETAQVELSRLKLDSIPREEVKRAVMAFVRQHRDGLLNFGSRYAGQIAADVQGDPKAIAAAIEKYIRIHLTEIAEAKPPFDDE